MAALKNFTGKPLHYIKIVFGAIFSILKVIFYDIFLSAIKTTIIGLPAVGLYYFYSLKIENFNVDFLGIYVLTPLAILVAFSGLLYGRARAVEGEQQSISVYAAEHALLGSIYYFLALVWGFVITSVYLMFKTDGLSFPIQYLKILFIPSFFGVSLAYFELYFGLSRIWQDLQKGIKKPNSN